MRILIAPNAFKNSLAADAVAEAISTGLQQSQLDCSTLCFPVGDGGDGTAALLTKHFGGMSVPVTVHDPLGRKIITSFGLTDNKTTAVIELADASGLRLLKPEEYDPLLTTSFGTGELIKHALDRGVKKIILGIGGSATVDGGVGILQALGVKFYDSDQNELGQVPASLINLHAIDVTGMDTRFTQTEIIELCDVANPLLGAAGAATVFGPQKGASEKQVEQLEQTLTRFRDVLLARTGKDMTSLKHGGASGGVAAGLHTFLQAKLVNGIEYFLDITGFDAALENSDLVITGEGSIDRQTLQGKAPFGVARRAKQKARPVIGLAGKVPLQADEALQEFFDVLLPISHEAMDLHTALNHTYDNLVRSGKLLGDLLRFQAVKY